MVRADIELKEYKIASKKDVFPQLIFRYTCPIGHTVEVSCGARGIVSKFAGGEFFCGLKTLLNLYLFE